MSVALAIIMAAAAGALGLGLCARGGRTMDLEQWCVGGRSFGTMFVFLLTAGETFTTFSLLGASGFAYGKGGAAYYILAYVALMYVMIYWLGPAIWRHGQRERLVSQAHFFVRRYDSRALGLLVAVIGCAALIPYFVLQLKGLGIIVAIASYGAIGPNAAIWIGAAILTAYVSVSGMRGAAWNSVVKDGLSLAIAVFLGIYLPFHLYGGYGPMFAAIAAAKPDFLALKTPGAGIVWFQSTVLVNALGGAMWPHFFPTIFTARSARAIRRNAVVMPLYGLMLLFTFFVGFAAILKVPGLQGGDIDLALLKLAVQSFPPWFVGVIGGAGLLMALVPGAVIVTAAATTLANDVYRGTLRPAASDEAVARMARLAVPAIVLVAVYFTLSGGATIVALLLLGYNLIAQFLPATIGALLPRNPVTKQGAFCGIVAGEAAFATFALGGVTIGGLLPFLPAAAQEVNPGFVALLLNTGVTLGVSAVTKPRVARLEAERA